MKKYSRLLIALFIILVLAAVLWFWNGRNNSDSVTSSDALWHTISQQCIPNQQQNNDPAPCLKVDLAERYILFKDRNGPYHDLLIPTDKVSGIESQDLQTGKAPPYFYLAWENRGHISTEFGKPLKDPLISLAINSQYGRSQNQLHIHIACLRQDVYNMLGKLADKIGQNWQLLPEKLAGDHYLARKLVGTDLIIEDPFKLLQQYAVEQGDSVANYGLALAVTPKGEMLLLANRLDQAKQNTGSAVLILDFQCEIGGQ
ncbi:CDP-diacylglycerol diphosphatase [Serratia symbiotica]|uniref:CDP-diacylglycerol diphosphatase n=1 Tax=Serratia symbiotica TaxID=138074 RepID=UPI0034648E03